MGRKQQIKEQQREAHDARLIVLALVASAVFGAVVIVAAGWRLFGVFL